MDDDLGYSNAPISPGELYTANQTANVPLSKPKPANVGSTKRYALINMVIMYWFTVGIHLVEGPIVKILAT